ncbi:MAG: GNAT family N-acetyltransferase [Ardenticatenaceae bacterium]|nr:GNAT family N-acetyltransferase [Ardenticatenaceae bacterium]
MTTIPTIETERLRLRPFTLEDAPTMHQILNGPDVLKYFPGPQTVTEAQVERMINRILAHWQEHGYGLWAVEERTTGALLGRCGLQLITETNEVEIDFILDPACWGQGFATEAGLASLKFGFEQLNLAEVVGIVHPENLASQRVLQKLGMQFAAATEYFGMAVHRYVITGTDFTDATI